MPLQNQFVEMPLIKGLDTKTDPKQVPLGKLLEAENVVFNRPGRIEKRKGFSQLSKNVLDTGGTITTGKAIANYREELIAFDQSDFYSYVEGADTWKDKGNFTSTYVASSPVTNGTAIDSEQDSAYHPNGLALFVFRSNDLTSSGLYYSVLDTTNGQTIISRKLFAASGAKPRVVTFKNTFLIYFVGTSNRIFVGVLPVGNVNATVSFTALTSTGTNENTFDPFSVFDVKVITTNLGENIYLCFGNTDTGPTTVTIRKYATPTGTPVQAAFALPDDGQSPPNYATAYSINLTHELFYNAILVSIGAAFSIPGGGELLVFVVSAALDNGSGGTDVIASGSDALGDEVRVTAISKSSEEFSVGLFIDYEDGPPGGEWTEIRYAELTESAGLIIITVDAKKIQDATLVSQCIGYDGIAYIVIAACPENQTTYFLIDQSFRVVARFYPKRGVRNLFGNLTVINQMSDTKFFLASRIVTDFSEVGGNTLTGVNLLSIDFFDTEKSYSRDELSNNLYVGGGLLYAYDGISLVEDNFNWFPSGSVVDDGTPGTTFSYQYIFTYEWVDNWGNIHVSTPSLPVTVTTLDPIGADGGDTTTSIEVTALTLTEKKPSLGRNPVLVCVYRTQDKQGTFRKLPITAANVNNTNERVLLLSDDTSDANLLSGEELYTTGDPKPLDFEPAPPVGALVTHKNRLFVLDSTDPLLIYFSNQVQPELPPAFNDAATLQIDPFGGPVTALASLDDKLIIFKENSIRYLVGNGPDIAGQNSDYETTTLITSDCGCSNTRSIVSTPAGIMFKSNKGIMLLNRGLQVVYIGNPVEKYNPFLVTSAVLTTKLNQVRLTLENNLCLVYDYFIDVWCAFANINAVDSIIWNNEHTYIRSNGAVLQENPNSYTDGTSAYPMKVSTTWLQFSGIQGFQRLYKFYILGDWRTPHRLKVQLYYDYNEAYSQEIIVEPQPLSTYGNSNYGSETPYGGVFNLYQYEIRPARQKCMCMKVVISDITSGSAPLGPSCDISNLRFEYGVIGKGNRLRDNQTVG